MNSWACPAPASASTSPVNCSAASALVLPLRNSVEMILTYLYDAVPRGMRAQIRGYRSGYLKGDRREIEAGFKEGSIKAVVATSALELGIDIGSLESVILVGYPGSIATTRQRAGRAGRRQQASLAMFIASPEAMDQYLPTIRNILRINLPKTRSWTPNNYAILIGICSALHSSRPSLKTTILAACRLSC